MSENVAFENQKLNPMNMKRTGIIAALLLGAAILLYSCSPKTTNGTVPLRKGNVTGNWLLNDITYEGIAESAIKTMFTDASPKCFVGSTWALTNSGNGSYTLPGGMGCEPKTQAIYWSVSAVDETFQFKKLNDGEKARNVTDGYRLVLSAADGQMMTLKSPVEVAGGSAYIVLHFTKK